MIIKVSNLLIRRRILSSSLYYSSDKKDSRNISEHNPEEITKDSLQWRTPWENRKDHWYSKLKAFSSDKNNIDILKIIQQPIDLSPTSIKNWWANKKLERDIFLQQYIPERNRILGDNLAAAHFIVHRGGAVKFIGENDWVKQDKNEEYTLPNKHVPNKFVEAIDCSNMQLFYEGLQNLNGLKKLEWLSINNCEYMDDWCIDRIGGLFYENLKYLDIRNCPKITDRGVGTLYKVRTLRTLYVDNRKASKSFEYTCLLLQELLPNLEIKT